MIEIEYHNFTRYPNIELMATRMGNYTLLHLIDHRCPTEKTIVLSSPPKSFTAGEDAGFILNEVDIFDKVPCKNKLYSIYLNEEERKNMCFLLTHSNVAKREK